MTCFLIVLVSSPWLGQNSPNDRDTGRKGFLPLTGHTPPWGEVRAGQKQEPCGLFLLTADFGDSHPQTCPQASPSIKTPVLGDS